MYTVTSKLQVVEGIGASRKFGVDEKQSFNFIEIIILSNLM